MSHQDLHGDAEEWQDGDEDTPCHSCGGPRAVYIPVWHDGGGILTGDEITEILERARLRVLELGYLETAGKLPPVNTALKNDIVMTIEGYRDGTFKAVIIAHGGDEGRREPVLHGTGSRLTGAVGWRHGLHVSSKVTEVTTEHDDAEGVRVFTGQPGVLNFTWKFKAPYGQAGDWRTRRNRG